MLVRILSRMAPFLVGLSTICFKWKLPVTRDVLILLKTSTNSTPAAGYLCSRNSGQRVMWAIVRPSLAGGGGVVAAVAIVV